MHWKTVLSVNLQWSLKTDKSPCRRGIFQEWRRKLKDFVKDVFSEEETAPCEEDVGFQDEGKLHVCFIPSFILAVQLQYKYTCFIFIPRFIPSFILAVYNTIIHASSSYRLHSARLLTPGFMFNPLPPNAADIYTENGRTVHFRSVRESTAYISNRDPASLGCFFGTELSCPPRLRFCLRGIRKDMFLPPWCKTICRTISLSSADNNSV